MAGGSRRLLAISCLLFFVDRLLKWYAISLPEPGEAFSLGPIHFGYYLNPALFFFPAWDWIPWVALSILLALFGFFLLDLFRISNFEFRISRFAIAPLILGGASNVFDRFAYGGVIDYVNIFGIATINIADILIFAGLIIILVIKPYD